MRRTYLSCTGVLVWVLSAAPSPPPDFDEQWPNWRGPDHTGMARTGAPVRWSTTENVEWKTPIPGKGHSTPIIWEDRIYLTTAIPTAPMPEPRRGDFTRPPRRPRAERGQDRPNQERRRPRGERRRRMPTALVEHKFEVLCLDKNTGKALWRNTAIVETPHEGYHRRYGSFASNSAVTDGRYVYAFFGSRGLYVYELDGKPAWKKNFGVKMKMRNGFGEGTAPVLHGDALVLNFDHEGQSFILALDKNTGKELWRRDRDERSTWTTPLVTEYAGTTQVIVTGDNKVRSYDLANGDLIWEMQRAGNQPGSHSGPSPRYRDRDDGAPQPQHAGHSTGPEGRPDRHGRGPLDQSAGQRLHRLPRLLRREALRPDGPGIDQLLRRRDRKNPSTTSNACPIPTSSRPRPWDPAAGSTWPASRATSSCSRWVRNTRCLPSIPCRTTSSSPRR